MKYFSIDEFTRSSTASKLKISNLPSAEHKANIELLTDNVLDKLREEAQRQASTAKEKLPTS